MPRVKKDEGGKPTTVNLYETQRFKLEALMKKTSKNKSEIIREWIEIAYNEAFKNAKEGLEVQRKNLEEVIHNLETVEEKKTEKTNSIIKKYADRKKSMDIKSLVNYEPRSKSWITLNIKELIEVFPNKNVDEIYNELEMRMKQ